MTFSNVPLYCRHYLYNIHSLRVASINEWASVGEAFAILSEELFPVEFYNSSQ
jgi:hypothetical protein